MLPKKNFSSIDSEATRIFRLFPFFIIMIISFFGCKKEYLFYDNPTIEILSAKVVSLTSFELVIKTDKGEGQIIQKAEIIFENITVSANSNITLELPIREERSQTDTIVFESKIPNHDFFAKTILTTDQHVYFGNSITLRSIKNEFIFTISSMVNNGEDFNIQAKFVNSFIPQSLEIKLNKAIPLEHTLSFSNNYSYGGYINAFGKVNLPDDIEAGIYEVYIYIDNLEFKAENNLKILKGKWTEMASNYPGDIRGQYAWFLNENKLFIVGGRIYNSSITDYPVWEYNLQSHSWQRKNNFPVTDEITPLCIIFPFRLEYQGNAYIVKRNDLVIEVWKYDFFNDSWELITNYPGKGNLLITCFISQGKLFIGGGIIYDNPHYTVNVYDFWEYNIQTGQWQEKNSLPNVLSSSDKLISQAINDKVFIFSLFSNELFCYDSNLDQWEKRKKFPGRNRITSNLELFNENLYLIAGHYNNYGYIGLNDSWEYSIETDSWDQIAFMPKMYSNGISFVYNNKIYAGLGYVTSNNQNYLEQNFYILENSP